MVYYSLPQIPFFATAAIVLRSNTPAAALIRDTVRRTNSTVLLYDLQTMDLRMGEKLGIRRVLAGLLAIFGAISLLLATIGLYGVIAQVVSERTQEIGVRMALGARPGQILRQFMIQGFRAASFGLACGAVVMLYIRKWIQHAVSRRWFRLGHDCALARRNPPRALVSRLVSLAPRLACLHTPRCATNK